MGHGYSNLDKYGWAGEAVKGIADFTLSIDERGNMSMGGFTINLLSIALAFGAGGLAIKGTKSLTKSILNIIPARFRKKLVSVVNGFVETVKQYTNINLHGIKASDIRKTIIDITKIITGDFTPIYKNFPARSNLKPAARLLNEFHKIGKNSKNIIMMAEGDVKGALNILNSNLKNMARLMEDSEIKTFLKGLSIASGYKKDLVLLTKSINEGIAKINEVSEAIKKGAKNSAIDPKKLIIKYNNDLKALEKLLKSNGLK